MLKSLTTATAAPLFPEERPTSQAVLEWWELFEPRLTPEQRALNLGLKPKSFVAYTPITLPGLLHASDADGVTARDAAASRRLRQSAVDTTRDRVESLRIATAELDDSIFTLLKEALKPHAPMLLDGEFLTVYHKRSF